MKNSLLARKLTKYKNATSNLIRGMGYNAPENAVFSKGDLTRAWGWAKDILPVVVKPNDGIMGKSVYVNLNSYEEFEECFKLVEKEHKEILIEEFVTGDEFRFSFVKDEVVGIAQRIPANVVGDGIHDVTELVALKNEERKARKNPLHKRLKVDEETERVLAKHGLTSSYKPKENEVVYLRENSNVSTGGDAVDVTESISVDLKETIEKVMKSIPGLRVCGVDVLIEDDNYTILEINPHAMLAMHEYPWKGNPKNISSIVVDYMFPKTTK